MLNSFPNLKFVWPHCGFGNHSQVEHMISSHSNLYVTLSKRELKRYKKLWISYDDDDLGGFAMVNPDFTSKVDGAIVNSDGKLFPEWKQLLETYPDRFMFATDCHKQLRWKAYKKIVDRWRNILGQLELSTARYIAYENAERIYKIL
jgi:predicted TIM-barrel fold metal-dependent hydrolase